MAQGLYFWLRQDSERDRHADDAMITSQEWLDARLPQHPYTADMPTSVRPESVPGDHVSAVLHKGTRTFAFATPEERDRAVALLADDGCPHHDD
jgi:hypothetical protein